MRVVQIPQLMLRQPSSGALGSKQVSDAMRVQMRSLQCKSDARWVGIIRWMGWLGVDGVDRVVVTIGVDGMVGITGVDGVRGCCSTYPAQSRRLRAM